MSSAVNTPNAAPFCSDETKRISPQVWMLTGDNRRAAHEVRMLRALLRREDPSDPAVRVFFFLWPFVCVRRAEVQGTHQFFFFVDGPYAARLRMLCFVSAGAGRSTGGNRKHETFVESVSVRRSTLEDVPFFGRWGGCLARRHSRGYAAGFGVPAGPQTTRTRFRERPGEDVKAGGRTSICRFYFCSRKFFNLLLLTFVGAPPPPPVFSPLPPAVGSQVARRAGLPPDRVCAEVLPGDKASKIEQLQVVFVVASGRLLLQQQGCRDSPTTFNQRFFTRFFSSTPTAVCA